MGLSHSAETVARLWLMPPKMPYSRHERPAPKPLNAAKLQDLALHYVARFACSAAKLDTYLRRKLRERGWEGENDPPVAALVERFVDAGYVDDLSYARTKSGSLLRRGYGQRRVNQALSAAGIAEDVREEVCPGEAKQREAALTYARKKRLGPFSPEPADRALRQKQFAAMLRAGHGMDAARILTEAQTIEAAESWAEEEQEDIEQ